MPTANDIYVINQNIGIQNGLVTVLPMPGQVGYAGATQQGSGGFILSYPVPEPERIQTVSDPGTAEGSVQTRYYQQDELRRERHGNPTLFHFDIQQVATQLLATNPARTKAVIANNGPNTVYLGHDNTVTGGTGLPLPSGQSYLDDATFSAWWAIAPAGSGDIRVQEVA